MEHSGYKASLMEAERLKGECVFGLPPGKRLNVIPIHCLPGCPEGWVRESGSYVCLVDCEKGLWFDWTMNDNDTAIIPSVKGMNPITGEQIKELRMEQYRDKCPKHDIALAHGGYCEKCGYNLPPQNYVSYPNTLWWDGFRQSDGSVRQFFFTEDEKRDIASLVIGKENTVPAFGFAFFKTKQTRFVEKVKERYFVGHTIAEPIWLVGDTTWSGGYTTDTLTNNCYNVNCSMTSSSRGATITETSYRCAEPMPFEKKVQMKKDVSVGAGAKINQSLEVDKLSLDEYIDKPQALIRLYFVFEEQLESIISKGGTVELKSKEGGYIDGLPVG